MVGVERGLVSLEVRHARLHPSVRPNSNSYYRRHESASPSAPPVFSSCPAVLPNLSPRLVLAADVLRAGDTLGSDLSEAIHERGRQERASD